MKPESADFLNKARQCLSGGRTNLSVNLSNDAGRNAYLTVFHAAQAYIFTVSGKIAKTHQGVHTLFAQLAKDDKNIPFDLQRFVSQAFDLKALADYELGPDSIIPLERSKAAVETADRFLECIVSIIGKTGSGKDQ